MRGSAQKDKKLEVRVTKEQRDLLSRAAEVRHATLSEFVRGIALEAAGRIVNGQLRFAMSQEHWKAFCRALDAPPQDLPRLKAFLSRKGAFDDDA
ncbi:MAG: DUF1778 domain-containing protein [Planctomycetes bacterium]|nr:DUF1778 domain-containing protein [Planctomycetota bacterium]